MIFPVGIVRKRFILLFGEKTGKSPPFWHGKQYSPF